jgi:hypothetical protein
MTEKRLSILAAVAVVMLAVTVVLYSRPTGRKGMSAAGGPLIQGLEPKNIGKIVIKSGKGTVTLQRGKSGFTVAEKGGYPASTKKINDLIIKCQEVRCGEKVTENPDNHEQLGVAEGAEDAVHVSFVGKDGKPLVGFFKGEGAEGGGGGVYVRLAGQDAVYATADYLWLNTAATDYIETKLIEVEKKNIQRVEVKVGDDAYTIRRGEGDDLVLEPVPEGKRPKNSEIETVFGALTRLDFDDVTPADKMELSWDAVYACHVKGGLKYKVRLATKDDKHYVRVAAEGPEGDRVEIKRTESDKELKKKEAILEAMEKAQTFTPTHKDWVYEISSHDAKKMRKPLEKLLADIPKAETPEEISARHILIAYKGAQRSKATRTKSESKALAERILAKAQAEGADFAALAKKNSDGPSAKKGGDLGRFKKGAMHEAFEKAAFKLDVGEVTSGLVETPFGFHIIKRTE